RSIKSIKPRGRHASLIILKNGEEIELYDSVDISDRNDGLLLFTSAKDPNYYSWDQIKQVNFD
ncbi:MAG: hypothetical protein KDD94_12655, partial [Calditrichaeota bacterium]|nr:hypothetical protein [Calditrichota bacterium]